MAKTLFTVKLPATGEESDFWVPEDLSMQTVTELIAQATEVANPDFYVCSPNAALMFEATGEILNPSATVAEIGLTDGSRFVLL